MQDNEVKALITAFKEYRDLITPIQAGLSDFASSYEGLRDNIDRLSTAFGGDIRERLESIYKTLAGQAEKANDLSARIDKFSESTAKYVANVDRLLAVFTKLSDRLSAVNDIQAKAEEQLGRLDALLAEKSKSYNVKDLQRTLEAYDTNVQRVAEFINKDVSESLIGNQKKLESIRDGMGELVKKQRADAVSLEKLLETNAATAETLKRLVEGGDVNEAYIYEIIDRWAADRRVKTK